MAVQTSEVTHKRKRSRSPSYPGIDIREALTRARVFYDAEGRNAAPVDAILAHWGYRPKSGAGLVILAALKKYGLIVDVGSRNKRQARLSDLARHILLDEREDSAERQQLVQAAVLSPTINRELWDEYGGSLPSDATLRHTLIFEKNFTDRAVREFIPVFKETLAYANLTNGGTLSPEDEDKPPTSEVKLTPPPPPPNAQAIQLPLATGEWATLQASFPLTKDKWKQMLAVLEAMKPALVRSENEKPQDEETTEAKG